MGKGGGVVREDERWGWGGDGVGNGWGVVREEERWGGEGEGGGGCERRREIGKGGGGGLG